MKLFWGTVMILIASSIATSATTVVLVTTKNGIAISSDSMTGLSGLDNRITSSIVQPKFVILKKRIVVAALGNAGFSSAEKNFNFLEWMAELQQKLSSDVTIDDVAKIISEESSERISIFDFNSLIKNGQYKIESRTALCTSFVEFLIVGYQNEVPRVILVDFNVDWTAKKLIGPTTSELASPNSHQVAVDPFGQIGAIADWANKESYAHQTAMNICPDALSKFDARKGIPSKSDSIAMSRALIQVEKNTNPNSVGGPIKSVFVAPSGEAEELSPDAGKNGDATTH